MGKKNNRKCYVCGVEYEYCPSCDKSPVKQYWKTITHNETCRTVFNLLSEYNTGIINEDTAIKELDSHNISDFSGFKPSIQEQLNNILDSAVSVSKVDEPADVIIEEPEEEVVYNFVYEDTSDDFDDDVETIDYTENYEDEI